ncbi:PTS sugar transporter subunit IIA [Lysinibacillus sp. NPDC048646]|uniref:PTS sugar transporter subunit IIA n=1 Tax=Lysinibacillus sp. NPDC048646 TaxID=3390574 RepID=UPI00117FFA62|nr:PTS sugar transporter subunit IIA [Lysinibacillus fusiformis]
MLSELLNKDTIQIANEVNNWQDAIRLASLPLLQQHKIEKRYIEAMIHSIEVHGPYAVLTPKVAIPHARPTEGVKELSMSLLSLQNPVQFGPDKPVYLIIVLAAIDDASHLRALVDLTQVLQEPTQIDSIIACQLPEDIVEKIKQYATKERL